MVLRSFPYPGSKARHVDWIIKNLPQHERYVEPFCGSAAVFLNKPKVVDEIINDIDGNIINFFEVVRDRPQALVDYLKMLPFSFEEYNRIVDDYYNNIYPEDPVERAAEFYYLRYCQFGSKADAPAGFSRTSTSIRSMAKTYKNSLSDLSKVTDRLMDALIDNRTFEWIIEHYDHEHAVFYCDPPYQGTEGKYRSGTMDHHELLNLLQKIEGKFLLSYDHKLDKEDWYSVKKESRYQINAGGKANTEYLYMNFDPKKTRILAGINQTNITDY